MKTNKKDNQSLLDVATQMCGSIEAIFDIAALNDISVTEHVHSGKEVLLPGVIDQTIANYFAQTTEIPASDFTKYPFGEGIEFWGIEVDFIVS